MPIRDEDGKVIYQDHYKIIKKPYIIIDSLERLMDLIKDVKEELIIDEGHILIYDGYVE